jgi:hypothetical protein
MWDGPSPVADGPVAVDAYESCVGRGMVADYASRIVPQEVDPDGAVVTAHLFSDNYFELYVNGRMVGRDSLGFTPFNASAVRVQARYPMTLAVRLVDWEGYLGVGTESRAGAVHVWDGGSIAAFSNGIVTDGSWRCRPVYIVRPRRSRLPPRRRRRTRGLVPLSEHGRYDPMPREQPAFHVPRRARPRRSPVGGARLRQRSVGRSETL